LNPAAPTKFMQLDGIFETLIGNQEEGPGLDEAGFRRRFAHLFRDAGAA
jgi:hypothetical protein